MKLGRYAIIGSMILGAGVVVAWFASSNAPAPHGAASEQPKAQLTANERTVVRPAAPPTQESRQPPSRTGLKSETSSLAARLHASDDYFQFVESVIGDARRGDRDAQYYVFEALRFCDIGYRSYFKGRGRNRTLDEALTWASTSGPLLDAEEARDIHRKCHRLKEENGSQFGMADTWLNEAADAGHPLAQAAKAFKLLAETTRAPTGMPSNDSAVSADQAVELLRHALRSKDPSVLWTVGDLAKPLSGDAVAAERLQWVWRLAACQRGYDCSEAAGWYRFACRLDPQHLCQPGEDGLDYIRRVTENEFIEIEREARDINAKVDADAWSELQLLAPRNG
jgi:hypothetical protein